MPCSNSGSGNKHGSLDLYNFNGTSITGEAQIVLAGLVADFTDFVGGVLIKLNTEDTDQSMATTVEQFVKAEVRFEYPASASRIAVQVTI